MGDGVIDVPGESSGSQRPYVVLSVAASLDGFIGDSGPKRLMLSNAEDLDRVDAVRAESDAILIGARTVRSDNPRLIVKSDGRRAARVERGLCEHPVKVTVTRSGDLGRDLRLWHSGGDKLVYTTDAGKLRLQSTLAGLAEVVSLGQVIDSFAPLLDDLGARGVQQLMVEGGGEIHSAFMAEGLADELHLAIAPVVVGKADAARFLNPGTYGAAGRRMRLVEARPVGDVALLRYLPKEES